MNVRVSLSCSLIATILALAFVLLAPVSVHAIDINWTNSAGGIFGDENNWQGGNFPGGSDTAIFNLPNAFTVDFSANATNDRLWLRSGEVMVDLNGNTYQLTNPNDTAVTTTSDLSIIVGDLNGDNAALTLTDGTLQGVQARIGNASGSQGIFVVTGTESTWTNSGALWVANSGAGQLTIADGGSVSSASGIVGRSSGSQGTVIITGEGSMWLTSGGTTIGSSGTGELTIAGGGTVMSATGSVGTLGTVIVTDEGSAWTSNGSFSVSGELDIENSGNVSSTTGSIAGVVTVTGEGSTWASNGQFSVSGELTISNGGIVSNTANWNVVTRGTVTVTGTGSAWTNSSTLFVGDSSIGLGQLTIADGGSVSSASGIVGRLDDTQGRAVVTGEDSTWTNSGTLSIGFFGTSVGELIIADGGSVSNTTGYIGESNGTQGSVTVTDAGTTWTNSGILYVGRSGTGELTIENGGAVSNMFGAIGSLNGSQGTVAVTGIGSRWTSSSLSVGDSGTGQMTIEDGGSVFSTSSRIGESGGSQGTAIVTGAGSAWTNTGTLTVGFSGMGTLTVENGGSVSNTTGWIGGGSLENGTVIVTGTGSTWTNSNLYLGLTGGATSASVLDILDDGLVIVQGETKPNDGTITVNGGTLRTGTLDARTGSFHHHDGNVEIVGGTYRQVSGLLTVSGNTPTAMPSFQLLNGATVSAVQSSGVQGVVLGNQVSRQGELVVSGGSTLNTTAPFTVGSSGTGQLTIENGGKVSNTTGILGSASGSLGTALVTGAGSTWTNSGTLGRLHVGTSGTGVLTIANGGIVSNTIGYVGENTGSQGTVLVTGAGSMWTNSNALYIGNSGTGQLTIENGGKVSNAVSGYIGFNSGSLGTITVTGTGSAWTNSSPLYVGRVGSGELTIANGGSVSNTTGYIGEFNGSQGTVTVNGTGSTWTSSSLVIGHQGAGELTIENGGDVFSSSSNLSGSVIWPLNSTGVGSATVTGVGSTWNNTGSLIVGWNNEGTLHVGDGGAVTTRHFFAALSSLSGNGTISVKGSVLDDVDLLFDGTHGAQQTIGFGTGGQLHLDINGTGVLGAGHRGNGTLTIAEGVAIQSTEGYLGHRLNSLGIGNVTGENSTWTNSGALYVGAWGTGELTVENGGRVFNTIGYLGGMPSSNEGGRTGTVTVTGDGSAWTNSSALYVGYQSSSSLRSELTISDGGKVANTAGSIGTISTRSSSGKVTVTDAGSMWNNNGTLTVGGSGELMIANGGEVFNTIGSIGYVTGGSALATVTGAGSKWTNSGSLTIAGDGFSNGSLTIANGGSVSNTTSSIALGTSAQGAVTVTGIGSSWTNTGALTIANASNSNGTLTIAGGGSVSSMGSRIGINSGSQGAVTVSGNGSTWTNNGTLHVGETGSGTLLVEVGGTVHTHTLHASMSSLSGDGVIFVNGGAVLDGVALVFDSTHGLQQTIGFGTGGQLHLDMNGTGTLGAGHKGLGGTFTIAEGITVLSTSGVLGSFSGSQGVGTVTGAGSTWTNSGTVSVGNSGAGQLTIANGGIVSNTSASLGGLGVSGSGTVTVTGSGSAWTNTGTISINRGTLNIANGGDVSNTTASIGLTSQGGTVTVTGAGSTWTNSGALSIASTFSSAVGQLNVQDGGSVSNTNGFIASPSGSQGSVTITGNGSTWTNTGNLILGGSSLTTASTGTGTLAVSDGGMVQVGGTLRVHTGDTVSLQPGGTIKTQHINPTNGTFSFTGGTLSFSGNVTGGLTVPVLGTIAGTGTVLGNVSNAGKIAPGNSPGILNISGNFTLQPTSRLEIEVDGLTPGTGHDQVIVTGAAALNGRLDVAILDNYVPQLGDEIQYLQAPTINGNFNALWSNLDSVSPNMTFQLLRANENDPNSNLTGRLRFVNKVPNQFISTAPQSDFNDPANYLLNEKPDSTTALDMHANSGNDQRIELGGSGQAFGQAGSARIRGSNSTMTLSVKDDSILSLITGADVESRGILEVDDGTIITNRILVLPDGAFVGKGLLEGNLINGEVPLGPNEGLAIVSPGLSTAPTEALQIDGNFHQGVGGALFVDVEGTTPNQFDTMNISGDVKLGGTLRIDATNLTMPAPGTTFDIITAGSLAVGEIFDSVETIGNDDIFFAPIYTTGSGPGSGSDIGSGGAFEPRVAVGVYNNGDMNRNGLIDQPDVQAFAVALTKPINYFSSFYIFGNESGDLNHDGRLDFDDIEGFAALVQGTGATAGDIARAIERELNPVPEPSSALLVLCGMAILMAIHFYRSPLSGCTKGVFQIGLPS